MPGDQRQRHAPVQLQSEVPPIGTILPCPPLRLLTPQPHLTIVPTLLVAEMCDCPGQDVASKTLLLHTMREYFRRGGLPRARRKAVLPRRLLQHVRPQVCRLQLAHHGELHFRPQRSVASRVLRLQGEYSLLSHHPPAQ